MRRLLVLCLAPLPSLAAEVESLTIGLTTGGSPIAASHVEAGRSDARLVAIVGGLDGGSATGVDEAVQRYAALADPDRDLELIAIPRANPESVALVFPPTGAAYRENPESHTLWRWLGLRAPDLVVIAGGDPAGFAGALESSDVAGVAPIPSVVISDVTSWTDAVPDDLRPSPAATVIAERRARTPAELADLLAPIYGQSFEIPIYIDGMGIIAHLNRGDVGHGQAMAAPYVDGSRDSLDSPFGVSSLVLAGHLVFAKLAELTGDERYLERARAAADFAFDDDGTMLEAMPAHGEMSDSIFMGASILAAVGDLTGEQRYFDMAVRHIDFMNSLVRRDDNLYRHSPLTDAAWGRGNGFGAIGYALTLSKLPTDHPSYSRLMSEYRALMQTLASWQNEDGTFSQVVDHPAAYHETSSTAIIGFSMQRGLNRGWLDPAFEDNVERAFRAVSMRTDGNGGFIDVSESTNKQPSLEAYLMREALFGQDSRTGSFALLFSVERSGE